MTVDIICPLYNAEKNIETLHKSLLKQNKVKINKIIYILTESKDNTEKILIRSGIPYSKIKKEDFSHSLTREGAALESKADILVFITQDIKIKREDWLFNLTKDIENGTVNASYSRQLCDNETIEKYWVINRSEYYRQQVFQAVENDKAQFASDNDTAMIQYIE